LQVLRNRGPFLFSFVIFPLFHRFCFRFCLFGVWFFWSERPRHYEQGEIGMKKSILLAVDGSPGGAQAANYVMKSADSASVTVVLVYVIEWSPYSFNTPEENAERHKRREGEIAKAKDSVVNPTKTLLESSGFTVEDVVRHGPPAETLINLASEHSVSEIVIGRRGQSGIKSLLFGSVAGSLIQTSHIPVVVVP
jgi:nucleotide-binding universal stress UspA family protein